MRKLALALAVLALPATVSQAAQIEEGMVLIPGGTFTMGSPVSERQRQADETQHQVTVRAFYVDPHEVTQQDYQAVMGTNPSHFQGDNLPVEQVTWYDAINYCNKLSEAQGLTPAYQIDGTTVTWNRAADGYRLLTEAEWEYAARAGTQTVFYEGGQIVADQVNFCGSYPYLIEENYLSHKNPEVVTSTYRQETMPVDGLAPNSWGLYHMEGNVSEWCFDYYGPYAAGQDPAGPSSGSLRVNRGGGWNDFAKHVRTAYRSVTTPDTVEQNLGFRIARNAEPGTGSVVTTYSLDLKTPEQPKVLVTYLSYTGNTEQGAQLMAEALGADLFTIEMEQPYRGNIYDVSQRDLNQDARPALATHVADMAQYDVVLVGYPTWWGTMPMPMFTFLNEYDFSGKTLLPFSSHGSTRFGDSISDFSKQVPGAYVGQAFEYYYSGGSELEAEVAAWLKESGLKPQE